jgi:hydrogenase-4 membrane subunit HyfE
MTMKEPRQRSTSSNVCLLLLAVAILAGCTAFAYVVLHSDLSKGQKDNYLWADGVLCFVGLVWTVGALTD